MDRPANRSTILPQELQNVFRPRDNKETIQNKTEEKLFSLTLSDARSTHSRNPSGQGKSSKITKAFHKDRDQTQQQPNKDNYFVKCEHPSLKYLISWEVDQGGMGRLGLENCAGYKSKVVIKKMAAQQPYDMKNLRVTDDQHLVNLREIFCDQGYIFLVYPFQGFAIDLAVACATPHVQFSEADIATVCRSILKGLDYIHEVLQVSHGDMNLKNVLLSEDGCIKIANIGRSILERHSLKGRRDDIKSVGLFVVHLKEPATILEDRRLHLYNPQNVSKQAKNFIEEVYTASCKLLLQHDFLLRATPDNETWSLIPHYYDAVRYAPCTPRAVEARSRDF